MFAAQKVGSRKLYWLLLAGCALPLGAVGQETFIYDQQSADEGALADGGGFLQSSQPFGQSFTPTMLSVGFIRWWLIGPGTVGDLTIYVNLRQNSINGPILGLTEPVLLPSTFGRN